MYLGFCLPVFFTNHTLIKDQKIIGLPECERGSEVAEEEVWDGQGEDEGVPGVEPKFAGAEDDDEEEEVQDRAQDDDRKVEPEQEVKGVVRHLGVPLK